MRTLTTAILSLGLWAGHLHAQAAPDAEFFEKKIRPVLAQRCQGCHNTRVKSSGLDLSSADGFAQGGGSGPLVSAESPDKSLLLRVVSYEDKLKMPPGKALSDAERADLAAWVMAGAPWPGGAAAKATRPANKSKEFTAEEKSFWAFQPVKAVPPPAVTNQAWVRTPVDAFILSKLEQRKLAPAAPADRLALLRRATFDLTGLPPSESEIKAFLADQAPDAFAKVVDRLLASPRYGEKWGRHWLDVARYADSTGNDEDHRYPHAWRYRDYVINAFNSDLPYDRFVREQIAGDLYASPDGSVNRQGVIATGMMAIGAKAIAQQDKKKMLYDVYDEQVDVLSRAFLGLTVACARCHDHKFDPILTRDYYSLVGIFASTKSFQDPATHVSELLHTPLVPTADYQRYTAAVNRLNYQNQQGDDLVDQYRWQYTEQQAGKVAAYMQAAHQVYAGKQDAAAVAQATGLDAELIKKWVKYLEPNGEALAHLDEWRAAPADRLPAVAQAYQDRFTKRLAEWTKELAAWREKFRAFPVESGEHYPRKPKFDPPTDRFFHEVTNGGGPFGFKKKEDAEKLVPAAAKDELARLRAAAKALKAALPPEPDMATAVQEGPPVAQKVFVRGDYNNLGEDAPKAFPTVLPHNKPDSVQGSGRRELAEWLSRPDHPLTARVFVNRVWGWHFGEALVRTPDNFGKMGERPTHPELLDYLASRFVSEGWSIKQLHRLIMLSNAYQMSTQVSDAAQQTDPENRLFSRFPRRRLSVEELRDGLLAIDGSIDLTMGGTLQKGTGTDSENSNDRLSINPEVIKRRMVYLPLRRANLPSLLNLFDFGDATTMQGKRTLTTVAPQALFMMNSKFIEERAQTVADSLLRDSSLTPRARVEELYLRVLNRPPQPAEVDTGLTYLAGFQQRFPARQPAAAWMSLSRVLIASNEFIYLD